MGLLLQVRAATQALEISGELVVTAVEAKQVLAALEGIEAAAQLVTVRR